MKITLCLLICVLVAVCAISLAHGAEISRRKVPGLEWVSQTDMDDRKKDQVLFGMFAAESKGLDGYEKAKHIRDTMQTMYGGKWLVAFWPVGPGNSVFNYERGFLGYFKYEGHWWIVAKVQGT